MTDDAQSPDAKTPETFSARLIRREAERRAALELATTTPAGLESAMARVSAEVTAEAAEARDLATAGSRQVIIVPAKLPQ